MKASEGQVALLKSYFLEYPLFFQKRIRKNSQLLESHTYLSIFVRQSGTFLIKRFKLGLSPAGECY